MIPSSSPTGSAAHQLDQLIETLKSSDPVAAAVMPVLEALFRGVADGTGSQRK